MIENLLDSLNAMLLQHPHLLSVMRTLFWVKSWLLFGILGIFVFLAYNEDRLNRLKKAAKRQAEEGVFIA